MPVYQAGCPAQNASVGRTTAVSVLQRIKPEGVIVLPNARKYYEAPQAQKDVCDPCPWQARSGTFTQLNLPLPGPDKSVSFARAGSEDFLTHELPATRKRHAWSRKRHTCSRKDMPDPERDTPVPGKTCLIQKETRLIQKETRLIQKETRLVQKETRLVQKETRLVQKETRLVQKETHLVQKETCLIQKGNMPGPERRHTCTRKDMPGPGRDKRDPERRHAWSRKETYLIQKETCLIQK
ncbi:hypothetical protein NDU88_000418 [Pleurodeles waltl]|uniref:Uncharacterized protein n=1 Tax=Pleurodeles waltl TaxID=8319 RepID=A0AAV7U4K6_PLEWA|nr:hypothetical protein NDU88_000418 [Pleurodeles waltl]